MGVGECVDADDVFLADFGEEITDDFVEVIVPQLHAIRSPDRSDAHFFLGILGGDFERRRRFLDQRLRGGVVHRHGEMLFLACGGRGGDGIYYLDGRRVRFGNGDPMAAGRALDLRPGQSRIGFQFLPAVGTNERHIHNDLEIGVESARK